MLCSLNVGVQENWWWEYGFWTSYRATSLVLPLPRVFQRSARASHESAQVKYSQFWAIRNWTVFTLRLAFDFISNLGAEASLAPVDGVLGTAR